MPITNSKMRGGPLNIAYFGSPDFSASLLRRLLDDEKALGLKIKIIFTQPDRPAGRRLTLHSTPVKQLTLERSIPVFDQPFKTNHEIVIRLLKEHDVDLAILFAFNDIIPRQILDTPLYGFWNIHPSLLPKYRGPSPVVYPIILGDQETGVTLMQMNAKMDAGNIIEQESFATSDTDTQQTLIARSEDCGFRLLARCIRNIDTVEYHPQDDSLATYTRKLNRGDGFIPLESIHKMVHGLTVDIQVFRPIYQYCTKNLSYTPPQYATSRSLYALWRGLHPWPGVWTLIPTKDGERRLKIVGMQSIDGNPEVTQVQMEGKNIVSLKEFQASYPGILA